MNNDVKEILERTGWSQEKLLKFTLAFIDEEDLSDELVTHLEMIHDEELEKDDSEEEEEELGF